MAWRRIDRVENCIKLALARLLKLESTHGWWNITDTAHTSINPLNIPASNRTKLIINTDVVVDIFGAEDMLVTEKFVDSNCKIDESNVGDSYLFTLSFSIKEDNKDRIFTIDLDTGLKVIFEKTESIDKGEEIKICMTSTVVISEPFAESGGSLYVTSDDDLDIFNTSLIVYRITKGSQ